MKKNLFVLMVLILSCTFAGHSQTPEKMGVAFKNAPVLFKLNGKMFQQLIAEIKADGSSEISFYNSSKELKKATLKTSSFWYPEN